MRNSVEQERDIRVKQLEILLSDYQTCREDDRVHLTIQSALFGIAVTLIGLMAAAVTQTCEFSKSASCVNVPDYILASTPLIPIALLAYITMLGVHATLRSYYMRGLEEEIRRHAVTPITSLGDIMPASFIGIMTEVASLRRGSLPYRMLINLVLVAIIIVFGGFTTYIGFHVGHVDQAAMAGLYGGIAVLLIWETGQGTRRGRHLFIHSAQNFLRRQGDTVLPKVHAAASGKSATEERPLISYLIFPRPEDWIKWLIAPGVFLATAWSFGAFGRWPRFLVIWLILEYLIYEARYQWNDARGIDEDQTHGARRARARLPVGPGAQHIGRNVLISMSAAAVRLVVALLVALALGLTGPVLLLMSLVFTIAIIYEVLRSVGSHSGPEKNTPKIVALWCIVGLGYGIRAAVGFIAGGLPARSVLTMIGVACFVALGIMFVLLTWVLEATAFCDVYNGGAWRVKPGKRVKAHVMLLLKYIPINAYWGERPDAIQSAADTSSVEGGDQRVLTTRGRVRTPWNMALILSATLGGVLGTGLAHAQPRYSSSALTASLSLAGALLMIACNSQIQRLAVTGIGALAVIGITLPFAALPLVLLAEGPWLAIGLLYIIFRGSSYDDLKKFGPRLVQVITSIGTVLRVGPLLLRIIVGSRTWQASGFGAVSSEIPVQIFLTDVSAGPAVEDSIRRLLLMSGVEHIEESELVVGSWYRSLLCVMKRAADSETAAGARRAVELQVLDRFQAGIDGVTGDAVAKLITALNETRGAVIQVGSVLLVKVDDIIVVRQLTSREMPHWQDNPALFKDPGSALAELQRARNSGDPVLRSPDRALPEIR